eukprot:UN01601
MQVMLDFNQFRAKQHVVEDNFMRQVEMAFTTTFYVNSTVFKKPEPEPEPQPEYNEKQLEEQLGHKEQEQEQEQQENNNHENLNNNNSNNNNNNENEFDLSTLQQYDTPESFAEYVIYDDSDEKKEYRRYLRQQEYYNDYNLLDSTLDTISNSLSLPPINPYKEDKDNGLTVRSFNSHFIDLEIYPNVNAPIFSDAQAITMPAGFNRIIIKTRNATMVNADYTLNLTTHLKDEKWIYFRSTCELYIQTNIKNIPQFDSE